MARTGIPSEMLDRIRGQIDLVRVIEESGVSLRPRGKNLVGKCPFHQDDTPSFSVSQQKQLYHCFGCGASGTVFTYISERKHIPFEEAVERLATRVGISLRDRNSKTADLERSIDAANRFAYEHFHNWLVDAAKGAKAQAYLDKRGVSPETIRDLGLGFAPDGWDNLMSAGKQAGLDSQLLLAAGLIRQNDRGRQYDYFRSRIIFPIRDVRGDVVAFGGRALDDSEPKYLNSPDTAVYKKSDVLYFLDVARQQAPNEGLILIAEGYLDAIALYQAGIKNVVAPLGTALSDSHARILKRYTEEVAFVFDGDEAGARAVERGAPHFLRQGMRTKVVVLPSGEDPDSFLKEHHPDDLRALLRGATPVIQYQIERAGRDLEASPADDKVRAVRELGDLVRVLPSRIYREEYADKIAADLGLTPDVVRDELRRHGVRLDVAVQGAEWSDGQASKPSNPRETIERRLLAYLLSFPEHAGTVFDQIAPNDFALPSHAGLARVLRTNVESAAATDPHELIDACSDEDMRDLIGGLMLESPPQTHVDEEIQACVDRIVKDSLRHMERERLDQDSPDEGGDELAIARELAAMSKERREATTRPGSVLERPGG